MISNSNNNRNNNDINTSSTLYPHILLFNCHSLSKTKIDTIEKYLSDYHPLALILQEVHKDDITTNKLSLSIPHYQLFSFPHDNRSGGIFIFVNSTVTACDINPLINGYNAPSLPNSIINNNTSSQYVSLRLRSNNYPKDIIIITAYIQSTADNTWQMWSFPYYSMILIK